jgi:hypothetical protein
MVDADVIGIAIPASQVVTNEFFSFAHDFDRQSIRRFAASAPSRQQADVSVPGRY